MPKIRGGGGHRRPEFAASKLDGGQPPKRYFGHPETMPYYYGPTPWRSHDEIIFRAREIKNISSIQDTTLLQRILHEKEFSRARRRERDRLFGRWVVEDHLVGPVTFNDEMQFLPMNPDFWLANEHMNETEELGGRSEWLQSELSPLVYGALFAKLIGRDDCDVHIIGEEAFMSDRLRVALVQRRPENFKYLLHEFQGKGAANRHIQLLRRSEKRFWLFFMHNASTTVEWSDNLRVTFSVAGAPDGDESKFHNR